MISRGELGADDGFPLACPESEAGDEAEPLPAVDERLLAILAPFVYDTGGDVIDAERTLPYDASLIARVTGQVALVDADAQVAKRLGQLRLRYFFIHDLVV